MALDALRVDGQVLLASGVGVVLGVVVLTIWCAAAAVVVDYQRPVLRQVRVVGRRNVDGVVPDVRTREEVVGCILRGVVVACYVCFSAAGNGGSGCAWCLVSYEQSGEPGLGL